jgi:hypothetical protein
MAGGTAMGISFPCDAAGEDGGMAGARCVTDGARCVTYGARYVSDGARCVTDGARCVTDGARCVTDGAHCVMAGFSPAIHDFPRSTHRKSWMAGTRPAMTQRTLAAAPGTDRMPIQGEYTP